MASYPSSCPPVPLTAEYVAKQREAVASLLPPRPPWKWPLTHAERIQELVAAKNDPNYVPQYENLDAAIRYHMSFTNQEQLCSLEIVWFQGGKQVGAPYQDDDQRPTWNEGAFQQMANAVGNNFLSAFYPLGPAIDSIDRTSEISIEITIPIARNGTGQRFTSTMGYDTGLNSLTIFQHELFSLFTNTGIQALRWTLVNMAGG